MNLLTQEQEAIVFKFQRAGEKFFHKVMTRGIVTEVVKGKDAYRLEFPLQFLLDHAKQFTENTILEIPKSGTQWPLGIRAREIKGEDTLNRIFAYGDDGWRKFVLDNDLKVGDLLIFRLVGFNRFKVHIYPCKKNRINKDRHEKSPEAAPEEFSADAADEAPIEITKCAACGRSPRPAPRFVATVIAKSARANTRLAVPGSFWKRHRQMLRGDIVLLTGPNNVAMKVKFTRARLGRVQLESGWGKFSNANELMTGDNLLFTLSGPSRFDVVILEYS